MNPVFLDTVGIIAILDEDDQWHEPAVVAYEKLRQDGAQTVTTPHILWECGNAAARRPYRQDMADLRVDVAPSKTLLAVTNSDERAAWVAYRSGTAGTAGIVDHVSFEVMRRLGIRQVLTNDKHFRVERIRGPVLIPLTPVPFSSSAAVTWQVTRAP